MNLFTKTTNPLYYSSLLLALVFVACGKFEYSPYQTEVHDEMPSDLNIKNLEKLKANEPNGDDTVTIIYSGDCQRFYDELKSLVTAVNKIPNVDFLVISGDIADFGILQEYLWIEKELKLLNVPYLCAIGNHDLASNNGEVYTKMFGAKNYAFNYKGYKFLMHDTNGREYNFNGSAPNMWWLTDQLNDTIPQYFVGISHVPPYDADFDKSLEFPYKNLFGSKPNFILSMHGHVHSASDTYYYNDHVRYMTSNSVEKKEVVLLKFIHGTIIKQMISY